jgi:hypothetical protein
VLSCSQFIAFENKSPTLAPTSGELTSTFELMASSDNQAEAALAMKLVLPITGGSFSEPVNKKQQKGAACWGAGSLHQVKMVPHPNYLLPGGPSAQGLSS